MLSRVPRSDMPQVPIAPEATEAPFRTIPIHARWRWHDRGVAGNDSERDHGCSRCGRRSDSVTLKELGGWVVDADSTLICSECCADVDEDSSVDRHTTRHTA